MHDTFSYAGWIVRGKNTDFFHLPQSDTSVYVLSFLMLFKAWPESASENQVP